MHVSLHRNLVLHSIADIFIVPVGCSPLLNWPLCVVCFFMQLHVRDAAWLRPSPRVVACDLTERPLGQQLVDSDNRRLSALTLVMTILAVRGPFPHPAACRRCTPYMAEGVCHMRPPAGAFLCCPCVECWSARRDGVAGARTFWGYGKRIARIRKSVGFEGVPLLCVVLVHCPTWSDIHLHVQVPVCLCVEAVVLHQVRVPLHVPL